MSRSLFAPALVLFAVAPAAEPAAPTDAAAAPPLFAPAPVAPAAKPKSITLETVSKLSATLPRYAQRKPPPRLAPDNTALVEPDRPRNTIIRLPSYIVREERVPKLKPIEVLTPAGRLDIALRRRPGLRIGSLPFFSNNGVALAMLEEDLALERRREEADLWGLYQYTESNVIPASLPPARSNEWVERGGSRQLGR